MFSFSGAPPRRLAVCERPAPGRSWRGRLGPRAGSHQLLWSWSSRAPRLGDSMI